MAVPSRIASSGATRSALERAAQLAERGFGSLSRRHLLAAGISDAQIHGWLRLGRLHRRYPGVYAWGRPDLPEKGQLAAGLLYAGRGAALAGLTGLWWRSLLNRRPTLIHIDVPSCASSRDDLLLRHPARFERDWHRDLPVVPVPNALLAAADALNHNSLRLVLARAEFEGCISFTELEAALGPGKRGSTAVRAAMAAHLPQLARCENRLEREFVLLCERFRLAIPEPNEPIGRFRPDMLWPDRMLIVELDGDRAHHTATQLQSDARKQAFLEGRGYLVLRFRWDEVFDGPAHVAAVVRPRLG